MPRSFESARELILDNVRPLPVEQVSLAEAVGRILAEPVCAPWDLPMWDNSAMDGFAVRCADAVAGAELPVVATIAAGASGVGVEVRPGTAVRILTGAPTPAGCDAVVPYEATEMVAPERVRILEPPQVGDHIRLRGEDIRADSEVLHAGTCLRPAEINLLASLGLTGVRVHRRPRVAIVSTGDELVEPGTVPGPGQIVNSNGLALAAAVQQAGGEPLLLGIAADDRDSLRRRLAEGLEADVLISSAGVSAGDRDLVRVVLEELGVRQLFWKIDVKPGRPTAFGLRDGKPVFSLPGNPVSALLTFEEFVRPALRRMQGDAQPMRPMRHATLAGPVVKKPGRTLLLRVVLRQEGDRLLAESSGDQNTGITSTLLRANGIAILPAERGAFEAGEQVPVHEI
ncbi:molybdopterin molybdochelatase [Geothermobacter ehrlichii]|uniref:Molybdopterin molybdenumtransferase n=1 Tax=Geothermobacter ehrlichii TaxID=213224 RepID=A0A5D3WH40_9BACT|nr:gephyrin-like molybdotransferase Glp [Geothermobacter ehrlichii]TYO95799.1 molybdopterin molybdochelatase [Geothermobacter ehrlichii]